MTKQHINILSFADSAEQAVPLAKLTGIKEMRVEVHHFPDEESLVTIPTNVSEHVIFVRSLNQPNSKLIELLLAAKTAKKYGAKRLTLIAPYLCYMRQDIENHPGEAVSQQIIGELMSSIFDDIITVDSHLHRVSSLDKVFSIKNAINILSTAPVTEFISQQFKSGVIFGPDIESTQWVTQIANQIGFESSVANKTRTGDQQIKIELTRDSYKGLDIIIIDDIASTGRTIGQAARLLKAAGANSISAIVTHALFFGDARQYLIDNGVSHIWSTNSITDKSNVIDLSGAIAAELEKII